MAGYGNLGAESAAVASVGRGITDDKSQRRSETSRYPENINFRDVTSSCCTRRSRAQHTDDFFRSPIADKVKPTIVAKYVTTKSVAMNRFGDTGSTVEYQPDGKRTITGGKSADYISGLLSIFQMAWDKVSDRDKIIFSQHMQLSGSLMSVEHREVFSYAMLHYYYELKHSNQYIPEVLREAIRLIPEYMLLLPDLPRPLSNEIRSLLLRTYSKG
ncbi:MAG: hypothetical protein WCL04_08810 [Verrucomicrobiota bacterium]